MRRMMVLLPAVVLALLGSGLGGCASDPERERLFEANRVLTARVQELRSELDECQATNQALMGSGDATTQAIARLQSQNSDLQRLVDEQQRTIREFEGRLAGIDVGGLDPVTDSALRRLAAQYPGLMSYDSARGMIRLASDLTFDSGSDVVKDQARASLQQLAGILTGSAASGYDMQVVGHTDNQPISNPQTAARFPTNMHLSVGRAISVRRELTTMGVPAGRVQAAGWGEHRPVVANNPSGGTAQNRRVEIFLLEGGSFSGTTDMAPAGSVGIERSTPTQQPDPTK